VEALEYISSGILESYALGFCTEEEAALVERLLEEDSAFHEEFLSIQANLELIAFSDAITPPKSIKSDLWKTLEFENESTEEAPIIQLNSAPSSVEAPKTIGTSRSWMSYAASVALILGSSSVAVYFYSENRSIHNQLASVENTNQTLKSKVDDSKESLGKITEQMAIIADASTRKITLAGLPTSKDSKAVVFWNEQKQEVILTGLNLPKAPSDKQYQLWALVDGVPVDAGVFEDNNATALQEMKTIGKSQAFAITLEPKGGSPTPHLETLCVIGNV